MSTQLGWFPGPTGVQYGVESILWHHRGRNPHGLTTEEDLEEEARILGKDDTGAEVQQNCL